MRRTFWLASLATLAVLVLASPSLHATTIRGSSQYGQGSNFSSWDLGLSDDAFSGGGLSGFTMVDCPNQDANGSACGPQSFALPCGTSTSLSCYDFLFQINSAPANAVLNFTGITDPNFSFGLVSCDAANLVLLCSNTSMANLAALGVTATPGTGTLSLAFTGAFPLYNVINAQSTDTQPGAGLGGVTIFIEESQPDGPNAPNLSLGTASTPAPEPASLALLGFGLLALGGKLRRKSA